MDREINKNILSHVIRVCNLNSVARNCAGLRGIARNCVELRGIV